LPVPVSPVTCSVPSPQSSRRSGSAQSRWCGAGSASFTFCGRTGARGSPRCAGAEHRRLLSLSNFANKPYSIARRRKARRSNSRHSMSLLGLTVRWPRNPSSSVRAKQARISALKLPLPYSNQNLNASAIIQTCVILPKIDLSILSKNAVLLYQYVKSFLR
jgi:hypothetical protein